MPVAELDGIEIAYELVGEGQPWVLTPGGRFTKEVGGLPEMARALADHGQAGAHLGPPELRRVVGRVPRRVGVGGAGRSARRAPSSSRSRPDRDRRRLGRRAGVAARRGTQPRRHGRPRDVVDQRRRARDCSSWPTTTACRRPTPRGTAGWKPSLELDQWQEVLAQQPGEPRALPLDGSPGVHRGDGPLDARLLPVRRLARPRPRRRRRRAPAASRSWCSAAARPTCRTPAPRPKRSPQGLPGAELVEPPWGDDEWNERRAAVEQVGSLFVRWPLLVPQLIDWADSDTSAEREKTMTTMTVQPIRDDLSFGAASAASPTTTSATTPCGAELRRALRGARAVDLRGRRAEPEDAGRVQHRLRAAQGPPEPGGDPGRRRRHARRHRDAPRAEPAGQGAASTVSCCRRGCPGTSTTATTTSSTAPACCAPWRSRPKAA